MYYIFLFIILFVLQMNYSQKFYYSNLVITPSEDFEWRNEIDFTHQYVSPEWEVKDTIYWETFIASEEECKKLKVLIKKIWMYKDLEEVPYYKVLNLLEENKWIDNEGIEHIECPQVKCEKILEWKC